MEDLNKAIRNILINYNDITDVVGDRVYTISRQMKLPTIPCIIIQRTGTAPNNTKAANSSVDSCTMQINCIGNYSDMLLLSRVVRDALDNYVGTSSGTIIQGCVFAGMNESGELDYIKADTVWFKGVQVLTSLYDIRVETGY